ncbi:hypothetical protein FFLO_06294 [Filobasidium floriforme]|uniref:Uncharacterized protein n=1 Tax=Filobasidium floriforme TaxID=5210 RepID=A0A8K0JF74_9TREE|nr:uncharacterized protein HD553DRAFT_342402 [Filobasidium floriforme]KAG7528262.1 hypothetical protein FFLO_06294 [Filobasidium floriforme]KAH8084016.1 hypothetical protein HD553DRAFT_342402 [Filobasidium floriforme]
MSRDKNYRDSFEGSNASERGGTGDKSKTKKYIIFGCVAIVVAVVFTVGTMRGWFDGDSPEGASASSV